MKVKEFMAGDPLISECGAQLRYYSVSADCRFWIKHNPVLMFVFTYNIHHVFVMYTDLLSLQYYNNL